MKVNKKLWSFNFGCLIAASCLWLIDFSKNAPFYEHFRELVNYNHYYYVFSLNAVLATVLTLTMLFIMAKVFKVCSSEHTFWLVLPILVLSTITVLYAKALLPAVLTVVFPCVLVASGVAAVMRVKQSKT